ncbi:MAG: phytanoyl-CoA dioxygenase family protein [Myxococcota bacterium]
MGDSRSSARRFLADANAASDDIHERWAADNEQWWDWYLTLAYDDGPGEPVDVPPLPELPDLSLEALEAELAVPYDLTAGAIGDFRREGYVKLPKVCSPAALLTLRRRFEALFAESPPVVMGFPSLEMMWTHDPVCRAFVVSPRLAGIAAGLLGAAAVRLYHDNALCKLPGAGRTPWHYDAHHYPIASENVVTLWAPLQPTPRPMGPLAFAEGIEAWRLVADLAFSKFDDSYDRGIAQALQRSQVGLHDEGFALGTVSFHHTRSLHTAGANRTSLARMALATTYLEDGARLVDEPTLISGDFEKFMPGIGPGDVIASPLNPVLFPEESS